MVLPAGPRINALTSPSDLPDVATDPIDMMRSPTCKCARAVPVADRLAISKPPAALGTIVAPIPVVADILDVCAVVRRWGRPFFSVCCGSHRPQHKHLLPPLCHSSCASHLLLLHHHLHHLHHLLLLLLVQCMWQPSALLAALYRASVVIPAILTAEGWQGWGSGHMCHSCVRWCAREPRGVGCWCEPSFSSN